LKFHYPAPVKGRIRLLLEAGPRAEKIGSSLPDFSGPGFEAPP